MKCATRSAIFFAAVLLFGPPARADVLPPEVQPCNGKQVGDACTYNGSGTCQNQTCSRLDYANWNRDASSGPPSMTYTCLECLGGTGPDGGPKDARPMDVRTMDAESMDTESIDAETNAAKDSGGPAVSDAEPATPEKDAAVIPISTDAATSVTRDAGAPAPANDNGSCSVGKGAAAKRVAPWLMAGAFSLLFLFARRRRR